MIAFAWWVFHPLTGKGYQLWSGIASDVGELAIIGGLITLVRQRNCHVHRCPRLIWHEHPEHGHPGLPETSPRLQEGDRMTIVAQYVTTFGMNEVDHPEPGLYLENDGSVTLVLPNGSQVTLNGGGGSAPVPFTSGHGTPVGVVTPASLGALYVDIDGGGLYIAATVADSGHWISLGGDVFIDDINTGEAAGQFGNESNQILLANQGGFSALGDVAGFDTGGTANAIYWRMNSGLDGAQTAEIRTGPEGQFTGILQDHLGIMTPASGIDASNFPTADPEVTGRVWVSEGLLVLSGFSPPGGLGLTGWTEDVQNPANVQSNGGSLDLGDGNLTAGGGIAGSFARFGNDVGASGLISSPQTSGALLTIDFVSGAGTQVGLPNWDTDADLLYVPYTTDGTNNAATLKIELSPDNVTYSTLTTISYAAALNLVGATTQLLSLKVPWNWYVKLTAAHCTIGTATAVAVPD